MGESLACELVDAGAVKFGSFTLKSGITSPFYVDLRVSVSYPKLLHDIADAVVAKIKEDNIEGDLLCGVPYTALPIATCVSITTEQPMVMVRKEVKAYGTKRPIEGTFHPGQKCIIIEDIVSSGSSIIEIAQALSTAGLVVTDAVVFLDREQGGRENLLKWNIQLHSIFHITSIMKKLVAKKRLTEEVASKVAAFVQAVKAPPGAFPPVAFAHQGHLRPSQPGGPVPARQAPPRADGPEADQPGSGRRCHQYRQIVGAG
ncbi:hypothetical protein MTO96_033078 [Rhipicephalus appendiculatus]